MVGVAFLPSFFLVFDCAKLSYSYTPGPGLLYGGVGGPNQRNLHKNQGLRSPNSYKAYTPCSLVTRFCAQICTDLHIKTLGISMTYAILLIFADFLRRGGPRPPGLFF